MMTTLDKKILLLVIDGLGDRPTATLGGYTPLDKAYKPNMNNLAKHSILGLLDNSMGLKEPTSDLAVLSLLGYAGHLGIKRSILEVMAENIRFQDGNLALHCNFATIADDLRRIIDRRVGRTLTREEAKVLEEHINEEVSLPHADFIFKHTVDYMGVLVIDDPRMSLSDEISDVDPWRKDQEKILSPCIPLAESDSAKRSCEHVDNFIKNSYNVLKNHPINRYRVKIGMLPANIILTRQASSKIPRNIVKFHERYGIKAGGQARLPTERGIMKLLGIDEIPLPDIDPKINLGGYYALRAKEVASSLNRYDFIYAHFDEADDAAHDRDPFKKKTIIEIWDEYFLGTLLEKIELDSVVIAITADHATVSDLGGHTDDAVPLLIYDGVRRRDRVNWGETSLKKDYDIKIDGPELISYLLRTAGFK